MIQKVLAWTLGVGFVFYGLIRFIGGILVMKALTSDSLDSEDIYGLQAGAEKVRDAIPDLSETAFIPFTSEGYMSYIIIMGAILIVGTIATLMRKRWGIWVMSSYFILYLFLFISMKVFNIKVAHLAVSFILFLIFLWLHKMAFVHNKEQSS